MCSGMAIKDKTELEKKFEKAACSLLAGIEATNGGDDVDENEITGRGALKKASWLTMDGWNGDSAGEGRWARKEGGGSSSY